METAGKEKMQPMNIVLVAGLGNPGAPYENTYHNVGTRAIDFLLGKYLLEKGARNMKRVRGFFEYAKTPEIIFVKPLVFMNESGKAIAKALHFFKVRPENTVVIHDDSDLYVGDFKISFGSGSAGHKGVESLVEQLGTKHFFRVRIGIRMPEEDAERRPKASELVLKNITPENQKQLQRVFENVAAALESKGGLLGRV